MGHFKHIKIKSKYIYIIFLIFYLFISSGHFYSADEDCYFYVAKNIVENFKFNIPDYSDFNISKNQNIKKELTRSLKDFGSIGKDRELYSSFGIGYSILLMPFIIIGRVLGEILKLDNYYILILQRIISSFLSAFIMSGIITLYYQFCIKIFKIESIYTVVACFILGICTPLAVYAKVNLNDIANALFLLAGYYYFVREKSFASGLCFGFAFLIRYESIVFFLVFLVYSFIKDYSSPKRFFMPFFIIIIIFAFYNYIRFSTIFFTGAATHAEERFTLNFMKGLIGIFLSPGKGIIFFSPVILINILGFYKMDYESKQKFSKIILPVCLFILIHASWYSWMGGFSWGPRRIVSVLAFFFLPLPWTLKYYKKLIRVWILLASFSFIVNLPAILFDYNIYLKEYFYKRDTLFNFKYSQVINQFKGFYLGYDYDFLICYLVNNFYLRCGIIIVVLSLYFYVWKRYIRDPFKGART